MSSLSLVVWHGAMHAARMLISCSSSPQCLRNARKTRTIAIVLSKTWNKSDRWARCDRTREPAIRHNPEFSSSGSNCQVGVDMRGRSRCQEGVHLILCHYALLPLFVLFHVEIHYKHIQQVRDPRSSHDVD